MKENYGFFGTIFAFGLYGAFGLTLLFPLGTWLFVPEMFDDGQYGMFIMGTFPFGWLFGSMIGLSRAWNDENIIKPRYPLLFSLGVIATGFFTLPFLGIISLMIFINFLKVILTPFIS
jgi:hypothetical protein